MSTTPTGISITRCATCERIHPVTRSHCTVCGLASAFLDHGGECLNCSPPDEATVDMPPAGEPNA